MAAMSQLVTVTFYLLLLTISSGDILTNKSIPEHVKNTFQQIQENGGHAPSGFKSESPFLNREEILPKVDDSGTKVLYTEYDVNPLQHSVSRGAERIVWGSNGNAFYTPDHYSTFWYMGNFAPPGSTGVLTVKPLMLLIIAACSFLGFITFRMGK